MIATRYNSFGTPSDVIEIIDVETRDLRDGEIRVKLEVAAINPADIFMIMGMYPLKSTFPIYPGGEGVGIVSEIGTNVTEIKIGDRVVIPFYASRSTWREEIVVHHSKVIPVPDGCTVASEQLAMTSVNPPSAYYMLTQYEQLEAGDWIIQNAANSAVGSCVLGFAKRLGLKTVNIVRREEVVDKVQQLGGDIVLVDGPDLAKRVSKLPEKPSIKLGLDAVAGSSTHRISQCVTDYGTVVNYGAMSMKHCEIGASQLIFKQIRLVGFWYHRWTQNASPKEVEELTAITNSAVFNGEISVPVHDVYKLADIKQALTVAFSGKTNGKVLLKGPAYS